LPIISSCTFLDDRKKISNEKYNITNREIINNFSKAITKNPNNFFFYLERGKAKQNFGDFRGAINDFNYSFNLNKDYKFIFYRANAKFDFGDYEGAIRDYEQLTLITDLKGIKDQIFFNIASAQLTNLNYSGALNNYSKAILYDDNDYYAYLNRGNTKFITNDYLGAIEDYSKSISINNESFVSFNNNGVSKFKTGNFKSALEDFKSSLKINPKNYNTLYNKSITLFKLNEKKKACIDLNKSIKLGKEVFEDEYLEICN
jgi:tetratricopeptide (TPR) repeat protein